MVVVISGTSKGLGLALAKKFIESGHQVVGFSRGENPGIFHSNYVHYRLDVSDSRQVHEAAAHIKFPTIDILINNAGLPGSGRKIEEVDPDEVKELLDVNLFGSLNIVQSFLKKLQLGVGKRIINISSRFGSLSFNQEPENRALRISYSYRISKAAQNMLAVCLDNELRDLGVRVDVLHPGSFQSNCGREDATLAPEEVSESIYGWIVSGKSTEITRMEEVGGRVFGW